MSILKIPKIFTIACLAVCLGIALIAVLAMVSERSQRRDSVYESLTQTSVASQTLIGPFLVFPYEITSSVSSLNEQGERTTRIESSTYFQYVRPKTLEMNIDLAAEKRFRSLFEIPFYRSEIALKGSFELTAPTLSSPPFPKGVRSKALPPLLMFLVEDSRGIVEWPEMVFRGQNLSVEAGFSGLGSLPASGFHAVLPTGVFDEKALSFSINLSLQGSQAFNWTPVSEVTRVSLNANWPHPSFQGAALPTTYSVSDRGFAAEWKNTQFSAPMPAELTRAFPLAALLSKKVGVKLIQTVDIYQQTERAVKYGFLLVGLTFLFFFGFETLGNLSIHPIQYGLVGFALVLFYVLLLALSEHISFGQSYLAASAACISLLSFYIRSLVKSGQATLGFTLIFVCLYSVIYGILMSEDYALLYGAIFLFTLLAGVMIGTRNVDWSKAGKDG